MFKEPKISKKASFQAPDLTQIRLFKGHEISKNVYLFFRSLKLPKKGLISGPRKSQNDGQILYPTNCRSVFIKKIIGVHNYRADNLQGT